MAVPNPWISSKSFKSLFYYILGSVWNKLIYYFSVNQIFRNEKTDKKTVSAIQSGVNECINITQMHQMASLKGICDYCDSNGVRRRSTDLLVWATSEETKFVRKSDNTNPFSTSHKDLLRNVRIFTWTPLQSRGGIHFLGFIGKCSNLPQKMD